MEVTTIVNTLLLMIGLLAIFAFILFTIKLLEDVPVPPVKPVPPPKSLQEADRDVELALQMLEDLSFKIGYEEGLKVDRLRQEADRKARNN